MRSTRRVLRSGFILLATVPLLGVGSCVVEAARYALDAPLWGYEREFTVDAWYEDVEVFYDDYIDDWF